MPYADPIKQREATARSARKRYQERPELRAYRYAYTVARREREALAEAAKVREDIRIKKENAKYGIIGKINLERR